MAAKKKVAMEVSLKVQLDEEAYGALQRSMDSPRKPTTKQVQKHFMEVIDEHIDQLVEDHPEPEADTDDDYA
jgi:hypothetical protein